MSSKDDSWSMIVYFGKQIGQELFTWMLQINYDASGQVQVVKENK